MFNSNNKCIYQTESMATLSYLKKLILKIWNLYIIIMIFFFSSNSALKNQNFASCAKGHGPGARVYKIFTYFISLQPAGKHCAAHSIEILPVLPHYWLPELNIPRINIVEGANMVLRKGYLRMEHILCQIKYI